MGSNVRIVDFIITVNGMEATEEFKDGRERVSLQPQYDVGKFPPKVKFPCQNS